MNVVRLIAPSKYSKDMVAGWHKYRVSGLCRTCREPFTMELMGTLESLEREAIDCDRCLDRVENEEGSK